MATQHNKHYLGTLMGQEPNHFGEDLVQFLTTEQRDAIREYTQLFDFLSDESLARLHTEFGVSVLHIGILHGIDTKRHKDLVFPVTPFTRRSP